MPFPENFEIPERYQGTHDKHEVKTVRHADWYLVPKEAFINLDDTTIQYECWLIQPFSRNIAHLPYKYTIVDLGLYSGE